MITIAICEDNPIAATQLEGLLPQYQSLLGEYNLFSYSGSSSILQDIKSGLCHPNIAFMDIELDHLTGIQTAKKINELLPDCQIIYLTNYLDYISDVYETNHVYYILKSQSEQYLPMAIEKTMEKLNQLKKPLLQIKCGKEIMNIHQTDILYLERILRKTEIFTTSGVLSTSESLPALKERLSPWFLYAHRSYVVNLYHVSNLNRDYLTLSNGNTISVGRTHYNELKKGFADFAFRF